MLIQFFISFLFLRKAYESKCLLDNDSEQRPFDGGVERKKRSDKTHLIFLFYLLIA